MESMLMSLMTDTVLSDTVKRDKFPNYFSEMKGFYLIIFR